MNDTSTQRVHDAIKRAGSYFDQCCEMRSGQSKKRMGSYYRFSPATLKTAILQLVWDPYDHPAIKAGAVGFIAKDFGGYFSMIRTAELASGCEIELTDPKDTGFVEGRVRNWPSMSTAVKVDFTVALLGPGKEGETLWTFHPGEPVTPSVLPSTGLKGEVITPGQAREMGLEWVKL